MEHIEGTFIPNGDDVTAALAKLFAGMSGDDQAKFFNEVAKISAGWKAPGCFQWRSMQEHLTPAGKTIINEMKDHTE